MVTSEVGHLVEGFGCYFGPELFNVGLYGRFHFPVVDADAAGFVESEVTLIIKTISKEAIHLFDAAFVSAFFLHDFVEKRNVEGDDGDCRACLGDESFVDGNEGVAIFVGEHLGDVFGRLF